ncbi:hypothetical protein [Longispora albida]|uniref:hypothetical protein n=1 Tax=Longispora albida TaxID=203523 RepID=UPI00037CC299|nr:hypothetical protein [Longispora albida]
MHLTQSYLDTLTARGLDAAALLPADRIPPILRAFYRERMLARPVFLNRAEVSQLTADLAALHGALAGLPEAVAGGSIARLARMAGLTAQQAEFAERSQAGLPLTRFTRADLYADTGGFKLLEYNVGSTIGLIEASLLNDALLRHPALAEFAAERGLGYVDMIGESLATMRLECGLPAGSRPVVALCDWPGEYPANEPALRLCGDLHRERYDVDTVATHLGRLEYRGGRVWAEGRPVDVVYRIFMLQHAVHPEARELIEPLLAAVERGEVRMFTPMGCQVFGSKAALGLLAAQEHPPATRESLDRILPWTRICRPGEVSIGGGETAELLDYAVAAREDLVLKPALLHGGHGVVPGWETTPEDWASRVKAGADGTWVLQRRVRPRPELMPAPGGGMADYIVNYGTFTMPSAPDGYGGTAVRVAPVASGVSVVGIFADPSVLLGCTMHEVSAP